MITKNQEIVQGWGRAASVQSLVARPSDVDELAACLGECARNQLPVALRAGGNSYGDLITNRDGVIIDISRLDRIVSTDWQEGVIVAEPGVALGRIVNESLTRGWILGVVPGSPSVTVGGAIGNNVHGKNSFRNGNFESCIRSMQVMSADGTIHVVNRDTGTERFLAVIGGLGLCGIVLEATLVLERVRSPLLEVEMIRFADAGGMMDLFDASTADWDMVVAWVDAFDEEGRGVLERGRWIDRPAGTVDELPSALLAGVTFGVLRRFTAAVARPFMCRPITAMVNAAVYRLMSVLPARKVRHFVQFNFIVTRYIPEPPLIYPGGMVEIQILVPADDGWLSVKRIIALGKRHKMESWWCGIKKHRADGYPLSFSGDGYSFSVNLPRRHIRAAAFGAFVDELVAMVAALGGRIYVGKDLVLRPEHVAAIFPGLAAFKETRQRLDPGGVFDNDLARRLFSR